MTFIQFIPLVEIKRGQNVAQTVVFIAWQIAIAKHKTARVIMIVVVAGVAIIVAAAALVVVSVPVAIAVVVIVIAAVINVVIKYLQLPPHKACQLWVQWFSGSVVHLVSSIRDVKVQKFSTNFLSLLCSCCFSIFIFILFFFGFLVVKQTQAK